MEPITVVRITIWTVLYADDAVLFLTTNTMRLTREILLLEDFCTEELLRVGYGKTRQLLEDALAEVQMLGRQCQAQSRALRILLYDEECMLA